MTQSYFCVLFFLSDHILSVIFACFDFIAYKEILWSACKRVPFVTRNKTFDHFLRFIWLVALFLKFLEGHQLLCILTSEWVLFWVALYSVIFGNFYGQKFIYFGTQSPKYIWVKGLLLKPSVTSDLVVKSVLSLVTHLQMVLLTQS